MAVLSKEEFFKALSERVGTDTSESALEFIENMTDTYNHMENEINDNNGENWQQRYEELDKAWSERYRRRFFTGTSAIPSEQTSSDEAVNERITIDNLFT